MTLQLGKTLHMRAFETLRCPCALKLSMIYRNENRNIETTFSR